MNQANQNINKDMIDCDSIDVDTLNFSDDQTCLLTLPSDSGVKVDIVDWSLSIEWPNEDSDYQKLESELYHLFDKILKSEVPTLYDKHKFDSRTWVKPKRRIQRPSINMSDSSTLSSIPQDVSVDNPNRYLTYNKYNLPFGGVNPILRLKTFNVDTNSDNSAAVKDYALKRRSLVQEDEPQLDVFEATLVSDASGRLSNEPIRVSKPINIDLSQPAHNLHNTFNKGLTNILNERGSLNMYQSGESLMRMSPPSLVSSMHMDNSGSFHPVPEPAPIPKDNGNSPAGRESFGPMLTSMTTSILDEKDMSTSFLSQTTYPDNDSLIDSLPPSLVSSVNSSYIVPNNKQRSDSQTESNIFSSATFTHLEQSGKLLNRPRHQMYNSFKRDSGLRNSESYTKSREEACQIDGLKKDSSLNRIGSDIAEKITLHYANNKFVRANNAEKENLNFTFEKDDAFYKEMGIQNAIDIGKNSMNVTMDKQELNEIIQARQKLSLARKALPDDKTTLPNQVDTSSTKTIQLPNQTITVPRHNMENASELLGRRRSINSNGINTEEVVRKTPERNLTFKKPSPKTTNLETTVVYMKQDDNNVIDINAATVNLINTDMTMQQDDWGSQERAMVGSTESTDTGTFSSSSPPESVPESTASSSRSKFALGEHQVSSTPVTAIRKCSRVDLLQLHHTISPIYDTVDDKSYTVTKAANAMERTYDMQKGISSTTINTTTMVRNSSVKRDILAGRVSPEKRDVLAERVSPEKRDVLAGRVSPEKRDVLAGRVSPEKRDILAGRVSPEKRTTVDPLRVSPTGSGPVVLTHAPTGLLKKTGLPTSKLRQYSSHRELNRVPTATSNLPTRPSYGLARGVMTRRGVYASNPVLSPTSSNAKPIQEPEKPKPTPALVRQGTETLRPRPQSQLVAPKDLRATTVPTGVPVATRYNVIPAPVSRPYPTAGASQPRLNRPSSANAQKPAPVVTQTLEPRPSSCQEQRSALPRPSRLPAPRRALRPPSVYSVAPAGDADHY